MRSAIARTLKSAGVITDEVFTVGFLLQPPGGGSPAGRASSVRVQTNQGMFSDRGCAPTPSSAGMGGVENDGSSNAYHRTLFTFALARCAGVRRYDGTPPAATVV